MEFVSVFTCGPARPRSGAVELSTAVLQQQVVLGLRDEPLAGLILSHHIQRLDHVMEVVGADKGQADMLEHLRGKTDFQNQLLILTAAIVLLM